MVKEKGKSEQKDEAIALKPIKIQRAQITIEGISPLIMHKWDEKAKEQMRQKHAGKKTKDRSVRDPDAEFNAAMYKLPDGTPCIPLTALKAALINAAHRDLGVEKTLVRKAVFILSPNEFGLLPLSGSQPKMREDCVRVGQGSTDLRYRPQFDKWEIAFNIEYDEELLQLTDICNLVDRAGFGVGLFEWRPEKGGEYGRFRIKR